MNQGPHKMPDDIGLRVGRLETQYESIQHDLHKLSRSIEAISDKLSASNKTNWAAILSAIGVAAALVTALGASWAAPISRDLNYLIKSQDLMADWQRNWIDRTSNINATQTEKIAALERRVFSGCETKEPR